MTTRPANWYWLSLLTTRMCGRLPAPILLHFLPLGLEPFGKLGIQAWELPT